jgi:hypothetical protein
MGGNVYVVNEYLEGLRIARTEYADIVAVRDRVERSSRIGIDCEAWVMVDSVRGGMLDWMTTNPNASAVCMADVPRYCEDVTPHLMFTPIIPASVGA